jgi:hypothetical protein
MLAVLVVFGVFELREGFAWRMNAFNSLKMSTIQLTPLTYKSVSIFVPSLPRINLLVKSEFEKDICAIVEGWKEQPLEKSEYSQKYIDEWLESGKAFLSTAEGTRSIYKSESKITNQRLSLVSSKRPKQKLMAVETYVNCGSKE